MRIAIKSAGTKISPEGAIAGHEAGDTLVRRLVRIFDHPIVVGPVRKRHADFDVVPLEFIDPEETIVVNMDVVDSPQVWAVVGGDQVEPRIMNFVWRPVPGGSPSVLTATFALSCALFPTFANSERTATEVRELVQRWTVQPLYEQAKLAWVNLGFRLEHVRARTHSPMPVVLYPAIYLSRTKNPDSFMRIVERVHKKTALRVEMRLHESHLISEKAMGISQRDWVWMGPLTATRASYWEALARTTAFLATAVEESYGLLYVEAMGAGVIGILPDRDWARALVPERYPFLYRDESQAEDMLARALRDPASCRRQLDAAVGGSFSAWIASHHSDDAFDREILAKVEEWFDARPGADRRLTSVSRDAP